MKCSHLSTDEVASQEAGTVLVAAVLAAAMMMSMTYLYFSSSLDDLGEIAKGMRRDRVFYIAEAGVGEAIDHLDRGGGARVIDRLDEDDWNYKVRILDRGIGDLGQEIFEIESLAEGESGVRTVNAVAEDQYRSPVLGAALQAGARCYVMGNTTIDGRDHDSLGLGIVGLGVNGFAAAGNGVLLNGPSIGGNGIAPLISPAAGDGVYRADLLFGDGVNDDGDGAADEEALDGLDNDGDGQIDEDLRAYIADPDELFNLPTDTIKRYCERRNTYFETADQLSTFIALRGGDFPGGEVVFVEAAVVGVDFGSNWNAEPSLLIVHTPDADAELVSIEGRFKGLIVTDKLAHLDGDIEILGGLYALKRAAIGNPIGLGSAYIGYSSRVVEELPRVPHFKIKAWRDVPGASIRTVDPPPEDDELGDSPSGLQ